MKIEWADFPVANGMRTGSTRRAISAQMMSAVRVETTADAEFDGKLHHHPNEQLLIMIDGAVELQIGDDTFWASHGDLVFFPPGVLHGAISVGDEGSLYYEVFSPARVDQLPGFIGPSALEY